ncbi:MAG: FAD:protein FMN transferase, partial [Solirubrobacteraceae bacterium]
GQLRPRPRTGAGHLRRIVSTLTRPGCAPPASPDEWQALGTTAVLRLNGGDGGLARRAIEDEIEAIDLAASRFRDDSELSAVNRQPGRWVPISPLLLEAITVGLRAAEITDGAVDPTLGKPLVDLGYDRDWQELTPVPVGVRSQRRPRLRVIHSRRPRWSAIGLSIDPPAVTVPEGVALDLGATAKALAADRAVRAAQRAAGGGILLALGGDIATAGPAPSDGWPVHVTDDHRAGPDAEGQTVSILSGGLATSSLAVRRWLHDGRPMHHILDPRDGEPVRPYWRTVSVAAASCVDANIAATAAIVFGPRARRWLAEQFVPARLTSVGGCVELLGGWPQ